ncbi:SAM-dependent methyltransferase [Legionella sp. W05-934-2]|uniref:SAM-dependent methyltransferase n=1 Tax=Legionella sp. W05-934-2 TaxID=1198649 RepID=UPI0034629591
MPKLIVVGSGIKSIAHLTEETKKVIQLADKVLYLVNEDHLKEWIEQEAKKAESLEPIYFSDENRGVAYQNITNYIVQEIEQFEILCVVFYGHPTVYADSALKAAVTIRENGGEAIILPAISSMDCLFADFQIDPGDKGLFCIDATELLIYERNIDPYSHVILFQPANLGRVDRQSTSNLHLLVDYLKQFYPSDYQVCIYKAAFLPGQDPNYNWTALDSVGNQLVDHQSTFYFPPLSEKAISKKYMDLLELT